MSISFEDLFQQLQEYIKHNDIATIDTPVGVSITASGNTILIKHSLSNPIGVKSLLEATEYIQQFLNSH